MLSRLHQPAGGGGLAKPSRLAEAQGNNGRACIREDIQIRASRIPCLQSVKKLNPRGLGKLVVQSIIVVKRVEFFSLLVEVTCASKQHAYCFINELTKMP